MGTQKIAIIGWDAAAFEVIDPLLRAGALPHLEALLARASWGRLASTLHPLSPTAWSSFMTGMNPGKHGVFDFVHLSEDGDFAFSTGATVGAPALWDRLSEAGRRVCVVNVPLTYPPRPVNGCMVSGMDSPRRNRAFTYPPGLGGELAGYLGGYRVDAGARGRPGVSVQAFTAHYVEELCDIVRMRARATCYLLDRCAPDLLVTVFTDTDRVQHALGHLMAGGPSADDGIGRVYRACDSALGTILERLDDEWVVLLMSDHGACAYERVFELSTWLVTQGWLQVRAARSPGPLADYVAPIRRRLARILLPPARRPLGREGFLNRILWEETRAFAVGAFGSIYVNLRGRFPKGTVQPGVEYEEVCAQITQGLLSLRDPETGQTIVEAVHRADQVYHGPFARLAPDLLVETRNEYFVRSNLDHLEGKLTYRASQYGGRSLAHTGRHTSHGILVAAGSPFDPGREQPGAHIMDLAPTVLYLSGLPVPSEMDGDLLLSWLDADYRREHPVDWQARSGEEKGTEREAPAYSEEEAAAVRARLEDLGYLG